MLRRLMSNPTGPRARRSQHTIAKTVGRRLQKANRVVGTGAIQPRPGDRVIARSARCCGVGGEYGGSAGYRAQRVAVDQANSQCRSTQRSDRLPDASLRLICDIIDDERGRRYGQSREIRRCLGDGICLVATGADQPGTGHGVGPAIACQVGRRAEGGAAAGHGGQHVRTDQPRGDDCAG